MILAFIGFMLLALLGCGFIICACVLLAFINGGLEFVGRSYVIMILVPLIIGIVLLWIAFSNAPFTVVVG